MIEIKIIFKKVIINMGNNDELSKKLNPQKTNIDKERNIVFIGMPGSGKSTLAELLSEKLNKFYFDSDKEIEKNEKMSILEIFNLKGEEYFRCIETKCIEKLLMSTGIILSVGGGAILKNSNLLKKYAFVIYIDRNIPNILSNIDITSRPLLKNGADRLYNLYKERQNLYETACNIKIENNGTLENTLKKILKVI
jgi:shikimate kinase